MTRLSFPRFFGAAAVVFLGVVVMGYAVGSLATPSHKPFAWIPATAAATAAGTTLLAIVTATLARITQQSVKFEAQIAAETYRPVLIEPEMTRRLTYNPETGGGTLTVQLRNVGGGPALNVFVRPTYLTTQDRGFSVNVAPGITAALPAGEAADITFRFAVTPPQDEECIRAFGAGAYSFDIRSTICHDRARRLVPDALVVLTIDPGTTDLPRPMP